MDIEKNKESEDDMKDEIDTGVQDFVERLKDGEGTLHEGCAESDVLLDNSKTVKTEDKPVADIQQRTITSAISVNLKLTKSKEELSDAEVSTPIETDQDQHTDDGAREGSQKRKQDKFLSEIHERAEVISKSARKSAEKVVSSMPSATPEDDPETEEFLKIIRAAPERDDCPPSTSVEPTESDDVEQVKPFPKSLSVPLELDIFNMPMPAESDDVEQVKPFPKSLSVPLELDIFNMPMEVNITLNLSAEKAKLSVGRAGLKGRRKPTPAARRRSLNLSAQETIEEVATTGAGTVVEEEGSTNESQSVVGDSLPSKSKREGARPRVRPKPKPKSNTVVGIVLPGLADAIQARQRKKEQFSSADVVREAAERRRTQIVKEDTVDKQPEKPKWLVEAEARRKMHDTRRQLQPLNKPVRSGTSETGKVTVISNGEAPQPLSPATEKPSARIENASAVSPLQVGVNVLPSWSQSARIPYRVSPGNVEKESDRVEQKPDDIGSSLFRTPNKKYSPVVLKSSSTSPNTKSSPQKPIVRRIRPSPTSPQKSDAGENSSPTSSISPRKWDAELAKITPSVSSVSPQTSDTKKIMTPEAISSVTLRKSGGVQSEGSHKPTSPSGKPTSPSDKPTCPSDKPTYPSGKTSTPLRAVPPRIKPKPKLVQTDKSQKVTVTSREVGDASPERRKSVELRRPAGGSRPISAIIAGSSIPAGTFRSRVGSMDYRPTRTGEILPQWKLDLMEKRKSVSSRTEEHNESAGAEPSSSTAIPQWKKELAERREQRGQQTGTPSANKENQPKKSQDSGEPLWRREILERKNKRTDGPRSRPQSEIIDADLPEWRQRLASMRRGQVHAAPTKNDSPDATVPSFIREFKLRKRYAVQKDKPSVPSRNTASYV